MRGSNDLTESILYGRAETIIGRNQTNRREVNGDEHRLTEYYDPEGELYLIELHQGSYLIEFEHNAPAADEDSFLSGTEENVFYKAPAMIYLDDGRPHRQGGPAVVTDDRQEWWHHGERHRQDGPAIIYENGDEEWFFQGRLHRAAVDGEQGPAITYQGPYDDAPVPQERLWFKDGVRHRDADASGETGPAHILYNITKYKPMVVDGQTVMPERWSEPETFEEWWQHGKLHRDQNRPAVVTSYGSCEYYHHGQRHRLDGPAIQNEKYPGREEFWIDGQKLTEKEWEEQNSPETASKLGR